MLNTHEKSLKNSCITEWCRCEKLRVMDRNVKCLSCGKVEALRERGFLSFFLINKLSLFFILVTFISVAKFEALVISNMDH